jgi:hypothetical protein
VSPLWPDAALAKAAWADAVTRGLVHDSATTKQAGIGSAPARSAKARRVLRPRLASIAL